MRKILSPKNKKMYTEHPKGTKISDYLFTNCVKFRRDKIFSVVSDH